MKYLLITRCSYSYKYEIEEFDTTEDLTAKVLASGLRDNAIIAQRVGLQMQVCEWAKPSAQPEEVLQQEAA